MVSFESAVLVSMQPLTNVVLKVLMNYGTLNGDDGFDAWETHGLGEVHLVWDKVDLGVNQNVFHNAAGAVHASDIVHVVQVFLSGQDNVKLVPKLKSWVASWYSMFILGKKCLLIPACERSTALEVCDHFH